MTEPVIYTRQLTRKFRSTVAVEGLDLEVSPGAIYALVGPNGAGKTTLIKMLMNLIRPSSGEARMMGIDSRQLAGKVFEQIGYVSENQRMPESMTVESLLRYLEGFYPAWDRALEQQLLRRFELPAGRKLKQLSRGMRMKAAFVSSLAFRPSLLVLDEPFSGLDPLVREELVETLIESVPETTVFLSSHDLAEIENVASHVGFLREGKLLFSEEVQGLLDRYRSVSLSFDGAASLPASLPASWLGAQTAERAARFVDSGYVEGASEREVAQRLPGARDVVFAPMSLREIFLATAKSARHSSNEAGAANEKETLA